jgi:hypothetical protein
MRQHTIRISPATSKLSTLSRPLSLQPQGAGSSYVASSMFASMFSAAYAADVLAVDAVAVDAVAVAGVDAYVPVVANRPENGRNAAFVSAWDTTEGALMSQALTCTSHKFNAKKHNTKTNKRPQSWCGVPPG